LECLSIRRMVQRHCWQLTLLLTMLHPLLFKCATGGTRASTVGHATAASTTSSITSSSANTNSAAADAAAAAAADAAPLPEAWDWSVASLRAALGRLAASAQPQHRQAGAVLKQQAEVVLRAAAVPSSRSDMTAAACRWVVGQDL
jgi:hypothetical protein